MPAVYPFEVLPVTFQGAFPNMAKRDEAVWRKFLALYADRYFGFSYNVAIGGIRLALAQGDPIDIDAWQYRTALKIDVCAFAADTVWIIEVKPEAQAGALGAALAYMLVAERERIFDRALKPAIVCEYIQPDIAWVAERLGVAVIIV